MRRFGSFSQGAPEMRFMKNVALWKTTRQLASCSIRLPASSQSKTASRKMRRCDDFHTHFRDGPALVATVAASVAGGFARAVAMPNLSPQPVTDVAAASAYRNRLTSALAESNKIAEPEQKRSLEFLMTLYLTESTTREDIRLAVERSAASVLGVKLYPAGATTNSAFGVRDWNNCEDALSAMEEYGLPLLIHGEVPRDDVDMFDKEKAFLSDWLDPMLDKYPRLKVTLEHITTKDAMEFVRDCQADIAATVTPQHLLLNRNALFSGAGGQGGRGTGLRPHNFCLPILKREIHRQALIAAVLDGALGGRIFAGTDSAPHARSAKESPCGCAGCFSAPFAIPLYALAFEEGSGQDLMTCDGLFELFTAFLSESGAKHYGLPLNSAEDELELVDEDNHIPQSMSYLPGEGHDSTIVPLLAGRKLRYKLKPSLPEESCNG